MPRRLLQPSEQWWHASNRDLSGRCCSGLKAWNTDQCLSRGAGGKVATRVCILGGTPEQSFSLDGRGLAGRLRRRALRAVAEEKTTRSLIYGLKSAARAPEKLEPTASAARDQDGPDPLAYPPTPIANVVHICLFGRGGLLPRARRTTASRVSRCPYKNQTYLSSCVPRRWRTAPEAVGPASTAGAALLYLTGV